jgi:hypothetical protein
MCLVGCRGGRARARVVAERHVREAGVGHVEAAQDVDLKRVGDGANGASLPAPGRNATSLADRLWSCASLRLVHLHGRAAGARRALFGRRGVGCAVMHSLETRLLRDPAEWDQEIAAMIDRPDKAGTR